MRAEWKRWLARIMVLCLLASDSTVALAQNSVSSGDSIETIAAKEVSEEVIAETDETAATDYEISEMESNVSGGDVSDGEIVALTLNGGVVCSEGLEIINYPKTEFYYGIDYISADGLVIRAYDEDGTYEDLKLWQNLNSAGYGYYVEKADGSGIDYDDTGHMPEGNYRFRVSNGDTGKGVTIPFVVKSTDEIENKIVIHAGEMAWNISKDETFHENKQRGQYVKIIFSEPGAYSITSSENAKIGIYNTTKNKGYYSGQTIYYYDVKEKNTTCVIYVSAENDTEITVTQIPELISVEKYGEWRNEYSYLEDAKWAERKVVVKFSDGSQKVYSPGDLWIYGIDEELKTKAGESYIESDSFGRMPVGEYKVCIYGEYDGINYIEEDIKVKSLEETALKYTVSKSSNVSIQGLTKLYREEFLSYNEGHVIELHVEDAGIYNFKFYLKDGSNEGNGWMSIYDSKFNRIRLDRAENCAWEFSTAGIYYLLVRENSDFDFSITAKKSVDRIEITEINKTAFYYGLESPTTDGLKANLYMSDGSVVQTKIWDSMWYENDLQVNPQTADGEYASNDSTGHLPVGSYQFVVSSNSSNATAVQPFEVIDPNSIEQSVDLSGSVVDLPTSANNLGTYIKVNITDAGNYEITFSNYGQLSLWDADYKQKISSGLGSRFKFEAQKAGTYYIKVASSYGITISLNKLLKVTKIEDISTEMNTTFYYGFDNVYADSSLKLKVTLEDDTEVIVRKWSNEWNKYGMQETAYTQNGNIASNDQNGRYAPGEYYWQYSNNTSDVTCKVPFTVIGLDTIEQELRNGDSKQVTVTGTVSYYKIVVEKAGSYEIKVATAYGYYGIAKEVRDADGGSVSWNGNVYEFTKAGSYYMRMRTYSSSDSVDATLTMNYIPKVTDVTIERVNGDGIYYNPFDGRSEVEADLKFTLYLEDGTEQIYTGTEINQSRYLQNKSITQKDSGNNLNSANGNYAAGDYTYTINCGGIEGSIDFTVKEASEILTEIKEDATVSVTKGETLYAKVVMEKAGLYELTTPANSCFAYYTVGESSAQYINGSTRKMSQTAEQGLYYIKFTASEDGVLSLNAKVNVTSAKLLNAPEKIYNLKSCNIINDYFSDLAVEVSFEDGTSQVFECNDDNWNAYGLWAQAYDANTGNRVGSALSIGQYKIVVQGHNLDINAEAAVEVVSYKEAENLPLNETFSFPNFQQLYKITVGEDTPFTWNAGNVQGVSMVLYSPSNKYEPLKTIKNPCIEEGYSFEIPATGTFYVKFFNTGRERNYPMTVKSLEDITSLKNKSTEEPRFAYGTWGYWIEQNVSGNKVSVSDNYNRRVNTAYLVSGSQVKDNRTRSASGNNVQPAFVFDITLGASRADNTIVDIFYNSWLWQAYNFIVDYFTTDGQAIYTDENGNVAIGDYVARVTADGQSVDIPFSVTESDTVKDIRKATITITEQNYTGEEVMPALEVVCNGEKLTANVDYTVTYKDNVEAGTHAKAVITGKGKYSGTVTKEFTIIKKKLETPKNIGAYNGTYGVFVKWSVVEGAEGYRVYRKTATSNWARIGEITDGEINEYKDTTVISGRQYNYTVRAVRGSELSDYNKVGKAIYYLAAPQISSVTEDQKNNAVVSWNKVNGAESYIVYRKTTGSWMKAAVLQNVSEYTDKNVEEGKTYTYTIRAVKGSIMSSYDETGKSITMSDTLKAPVLSEPSLSGKNVLVKWSKVAKADGYIVYRKTQWTNWMRVSVLGKEATEYLDTTVNNGVTYTYTVRATRGNELSDYDKTGKSIKVPELEKLTMPVLNDVTVSSGKAIVTWGKVSAAEEYYVYRRSGNANWTRIKEIAGADNTRYEDASVKEGFTYAYTVRAVRGMELSDYDKAGKSVTIPVPVSLKTPTLQTAVNEVGGVKISWSKVENAAGYLVYRKTAQSGWSRIGELKNGSTVSFKDTRAVSGTTYAYTVRAVDSTGRMSDYDKSGISKLYLEAPEVSSLTAGSNGVKITWQKAAGAESYVVYRKSGRAGWSRIATVNGNITQYTDKNAVKGTKYSYTIRAVKGSTMSGYYDGGAKSITF